MMLSMVLDARTCCAGAEPDPFGFSYVRDSAHLREL